MIRIQRIWDQVKLGFKKKRDFSELPWGFSKKKAIEKTSELYHL